MWQMRKIRLWEKAGWIIIRSRETARKLGLYMEKERDMRYEKFQTTGQERIRLACALEGFFLTNECEEEKKNCLWPVSEAKNPSCYGSFDPGRERGENGALGEFWLVWSRRTGEFYLYCQKRAKAGEPGVADEVKGSEIRI